MTLVVAKRPLVSVTEYVGNYGKPDTTKTWDPQTGKRDVLSLIISTRTYGRASNGAKWIHQFRIYFFLCSSLPACTRHLFHGSGRSPCVSQSQRPLSPRQPVIWLLSACQWSFPGRGQTNIRHREAPAKQLHLLYFFWYLVLKRTIYKQAWRPETNVTLPHPLRVKYIWESL